MSRTALLVTGSVLAVLCVLALLVHLAFEMTRRGQDLRRVVLITDHVVSGIAHSNGANGERETCRLIDRSYDIQWESICTTPVLDTYWGDAPGRRRSFHANCGVDVRIEDRPFRQSREVQMLVMYEYDDFTSFRDQGFPEALDELEDGVDAWEAYQAQLPSRGARDATRPPSPHQLREFSLRFEPTEIEFHKCENANFLHIRGSFLEQSDWAEIR